MSNDGPFRVALLGAWGDRCAWCRTPIALTEMQVDHVVPQSLSGGKLRDALQALGQSADYDLTCTYNLVPACRRCNRFKGDRVPPVDAPVIVFFLQTCRERAPRIDESAQKLKTKKKVSEAIALLESVSGLVLTDEQLREIEAASAAAQAEIVETVGHPVTLHPALFRLLDPAAWNVVKELSAETVVVRSGGQVGYTSTSYDFVCGRCGSHGPWSGARCLTCGALDDGA